MNIEHHITAVGPFTPQQVEIFDQRLGRVECVCNFTEAEAVGVPVTVRGSRLISQDEMNNHRTTICVSAGSGMNNIHGEPKTNCPGGNAPEVAAHTMAMLLKMMSERGEVRPLPCGIIGPGHVGMQIAELLHVIGFDNQSFLGTRSHPALPTALDLVSLIKQCRIIIVATGAENIIEPKHVELMGQEHMFINVGRGEAIPLEILRELRSNGVACAVDVWPDEPRQNQPIPESMHELISQGVWGTMHAAAQQPTADARTAHMVVDTVMRHARYGTLPIYPDPTKQYQQITRRPVSRIPLSTLVSGSPDVKRVTTLAKHLNKTVGTRAPWSPKYIEVDTTNPESLLGILTTNTI